MQMHSSRSLYAIHGIAGGQRASSEVGWLEQLGTALTRLSQAAARNVRRRRAINELSHMDDRMLRDIGIRRSEINRLVLHGRRQPAIETNSWRGSR